MEIYKQIPDTIYYISNFGNIKKNDKILKKYITKTKYYCIQLTDPNNKSIKKHQQIHRLVYSTFHNINLSFHDKIYHKDKNTINNHLDNLYLKKYKNSSDKIKLEKKSLILDMN